MRQIKFSDSDSGAEYLVTLFVDGNVEVETRWWEDQIWSPIRDVEVIEITEEGEIT